MKNPPARLPDINEMALLSSWQFKLTKGVQKAIIGKMFDSSVWKEAVLIDN